jgi:hypothetical protein
MNCEPNFRLEKSGEFKKAVDADLMSITLLNFQLTASQSNSLRKT